MSLTDLNGNESPHNFFFRHARWKIEPSFCPRFAIGLHPVSLEFGLGLPYRSAHRHLLSASYAHGAYRNPDLYLYDIRAERDFKIQERFQINGVVDLFNILNRNAANTLGSQITVKSLTIAAPGNALDGTKSTYQGFLAPTVVLPPRVMRLDVRFTFIGKPKEQFGADCDSSQSAFLFRLELTRRPPHDTIRGY